MNEKSKNESGSNNSKKDISDSLMANVVKSNSEILNSALKKIKSPDNKEKAKAFIKLFADRKISKSTTVSHQLLDFVAYEGKTAKQKEKIVGNHDKSIDKFIDAPTASETQRKTKK